MTGPARPTPALPPALPAVLAHLTPRVAAVVADVKAGLEVLRSAHVLLAEGLVEGCLNRAYYAMFYAAQAALREAGDAPKTHSGTHTQFSRRFVVPGLASPQTARLLSDAFDARLRADYDALSVVDENAAADALAERFAAAVRPLVT